MKLAAIDIGSNAIRLQIVSVIEEGDLISFKKLELLRFPLRLGKDVFNKGQISRPVIEQFSKLMQTFRLLIELYHVDAYYAVATSAMREAINGADVRDELERQTGIDIHIISGIEEAGILHKAIIPYVTSGQCIHIDVGGGSTELNLYQNMKVVDSRTFKLGSVRKLSIKERNKTFTEIKEWIKNSAFSKKHDVIGIGTGGNINQLAKLSLRFQAMSLSLVELKAIRAYLNEYTYEQRISILKLNDDRADVIVPAAEIYIRALESVGADSILAPKVGLKDGIIYELFERTTHRDIRKLEYV